MADRIVCPKCGMAFNPSSYVRHACMENQTAQMLTRHMEKLLRNTKRKAVVMQQDLSGKNGTFPEVDESVENRMEALRFWAGYLSDLREQRIQSTMGAIRSSLKLRRLRGKHKKFWQKRYAELLGVQQTGI